MESARRKIAQSAGFFLLAFFLASPQIFALLLEVEGKEGGEDAMGGEGEVERRRGEEEAR